MSETIITHSIFVEIVVFLKSINFDKLIVVKVFFFIFVIIKILNFSIVWLLDTSVSFHMTSNFINYVVILDISIENIEEKFKFFDYDIVRFFCDIFNRDRYLFIHQMLYISNCIYNFFFFFQLQQNDCFLFIILNNFTVSNKNIHALKQQDFYIL